MTGTDSPQSRGGRARAASLSAEERRAIARNAAEVRWGKRPAPAKPPRRKWVRLPAVTYARPARRPWGVPRCEANVSEFTRRWRDLSGSDHLCEMRGRYIIDGVHLCKRHAGQYLLRLALIDIPAPPGADV